MEGLKALFLLIGYIALGLFMQSTLTLSILGALVVFAVLPVYL